ncbi:MAG: hypothetical protein Q9159_007622 [Coniocarpon cinnabarinum]
MADAPNSAARGLHIDDHQRTIQAANIVPSSTSVLIVTPSPLFCKIGKSATDRDRLKKMHIPRPAAWALLGAAVTLAAPAHDRDQAPLRQGLQYDAAPGGVPFTRSHRDPYDHKVDTVGNGLQPLPIVSLSRRLVVVMKKVNMYLVGPRCPLR